MFFDRVFPYHLLSYSFLTGLTLWHSFISGPVAFKILPRQQFGLLQGKLFPIYFLLQSFLSGLCFFTTSERTGRIIFLIDATCGLINLGIIGPLIRKTMTERNKLENQQDQQNTDTNVKDQLNKLNKRFGITHGISSIINMIIVISLVIYPFLLPENPL